MPTTIPLLHFNDVYRLRQEDRSLGGSGVIDASQFAAKILRLRAQWGDEPRAQAAGASSEDAATFTQGEKVNGLVLFSGDVFNPSVESSVSRGRHMVPLLNALTIDAACLGNHDFDFGFPHLSSLMRETQFPWTFANIADVPDASGSDAESADARSEEPQPGDGQVPGTQRFVIKVVNGVRVAMVGLVEKDWIDTIPVWPTTFHFRSMTSCARLLSEELRDPNGPHKVDLIIAITHCRLPNDIDLANETGAVVPAPQEHGVDLILGGHDHLFYTGPVATFEGEPFETPIGSEKDEKCAIVKSGTDFRDLSEIELEISEPGEGVRRRTITAIKVERHTTKPDDPPLPELQKQIDEILAKVDDSMGQPVAVTLTPWDTRMDKVRLQESAISNFIADIVRQSYESVICDRARRGELGPKRSGLAREVDCALLCGGSFRGDSVFGPGKITVRQIIEILPFEDPVVLLELTGQQIWDALENAFSAYPRQEGRFPQLSGLQVAWDSRRPPGSRVVEVYLLEDGHLFQTDAEGRRAEATPITDYDFARSDKGGYEVEVHKPKLKKGSKLDLQKKYRVATREYMIGHDGFNSLIDGKEIIGHENGVLMSTLVRKYLLGASMIWRMRQIRNASQGAEDGEISGRILSRKTHDAIERAHHISQRGDGKGSPETPRKGGPLNADHLRFVVDASPGGIRDALHASAAEHHSQYDRASRHFSSRTPSQSFERADAKDTQATRSSRDASSSSADVDLSVSTDLADMLEQHIEISTEAAEELREASADLAIVAPFIDGRLIDLAQEDKK